jgi:hypothetical protein
LLEFYELIINSLQESSKSKGSLQDFENLLQIADLRIEITHFTIENFLCTIQSKIYGLTFLFLFWLKNNYLLILCS